MAKRKNTSPSAVRGRPRNPAKLESLLTTACRLFTTHDVNEVTMERIAAEAHVAKTTLYLYFKDKDAILEAVARQEAERLLSDDFAAQHRNMDFANVLVDIGKRLLNSSTMPEERGWQRFTFNLAISHPHLAVRMFEAGPNRVMRTLKTILSDGISEGRLKPVDLEVAADVLVGLWEGFYRIEVEAGMRSEPNPQEIQMRAERGVELFLRLFGCDISPDGSR